MKTISISRSGSQPSSKGAAEYFTGSVRIDYLFNANEPLHASGGRVTFEPGARTAWHTHPYGPDTDRNGRYRLGPAMGPADRGNQGRRRCQDPAGCEALARGHGNDGFDAYRNSGAARG